MPNIIMCDQPSGGVDYLKLLLDDQLTSYEIASENVRSYAFSSASSLVNVTFPAVIGTVGDYAFYGSGIETIHIKKISKLGPASTASYVFRGSAVKTAVIEDISGSITPFGASCFHLASYLETVDIGKVDKLAYNSFINSTPCNKLILRNPTLIPLGDVRFFQGSVFASGGTGGTIYIPKSLYDHLGDGTSNDYKAATNWSTVDGYGTITWAKIEGTAYDGLWADGTPIA